MLFQTRSEWKSWLLQLKNESNASDACVTLGLPFLSLPPRVLSVALVYFVRSLPTLASAIALWSARPSRLDSLEDRLVMELTACLPGTPSLHTSQSSNSSSSSSSNNNSVQLNRFYSEPMLKSSVPFNDSPDLATFFSKPNSRRSSDLLLQLDEEEDEAKEEVVSWHSLRDFISPLARGDVSKDVLEKICRLLGLPFLLDVKNWEFDISSLCTSVYYMLICSSYWSSARLQCSENGVLRLAEDDLKSDFGRMETITVDNMKLNNRKNMEIMKPSGEDNVNANNDDSIIRSKKNNIVLNGLSSTNNSNSSSNANYFGNAISNSPKKGGKLLRRDRTPDVPDRVSEGTNRDEIELSVNRRDNVEILVDRKEGKVDGPPNRLVRKTVPTRQEQDPIESPKKRTKIDENNSFSHHSFKKSTFTAPNANNSNTVNRNLQAPIEVEKRQTPFLAAPPLGVLDRIDRAKSQRMYLIMKRPFEPDSLSREYVVLGTSAYNFFFSSFAYLVGSMGNVYAVTVGPLPSCDCPDHARGNLCKHILFIYLKVLKLKRPHLMYQTSLLNSELKQIFEDSDSIRGGRHSIPMANETVREKYEQFLQEGKMEEEEQVVTKRKEVAQQHIEETSQCPVCYEEFLSSNEPVVYCQFGCGNNVHASCFNEWCKVHPSYPTCVICRSLWTEENYEEKRDEELKAKKARSYMNLAAFQQQSCDPHPDVMDDSQAQ
jgi:hypothetical protein